mmetsp:Transcript_67459/g.161847  ORF Transcript_67459/g.161847 Transcript_67459/m.161847 type:complete len:647 (-) Transcript_67459:65-2005(-)
MVNKVSSDVGRRLEALRSENLSFCSEVKSLQLRLAELRANRSAPRLSQGPGGPGIPQPADPESQSSAEDLLRPAKRAPPPHALVAEDMGSGPVISGPGLTTPSQRLAAALGKKDVPRSEYLPRQPPPPVEQSDESGSPTSAQNAGGAASGRYKRRVQQFALQPEPQKQGCPDDQGASHQPTSMYPSSPDVGFRQVASPLVPRDSTTRSQRSTALRGHGSQPSPRRMVQSVDSSLDQLKSENNRLTEQLVEVSLESAQNSQTFSNDRNALLRLTQDLRQRVQSEQAERARCTAMLSATQEALEKMAAENLRMAEDMMQSRTSSIVPTALGHNIAEFAEATSSSTRTSDGGATALPEDASKLKEEVWRRTEEVTKLRQLIHEQTTKANATILDMARRNVELEKQLQKALHPRPSVSSAHGQHAPLRSGRAASAPSGSPCASSRRKDQVQPLSSSRRKASESNALRKPARSQSGPPPQTRERAPRLNGINSSASPMPAGPRRSQSAARLQHMQSPGRAREAPPPQPRTPSSGSALLSGHTTPRCVSSSVWLPAYNAASPAPTRRQAEVTSTPISGLRGNRHSHHSSPTPSSSPMIGSDGRYTGRGVAIRRGPRNQAPSAQPIAELERDLVHASSEMRRMQEKAVLAAAC